jgi:predicted ATPase
MLNVKLKNLGNIKEAEIQLNKLTIFAGENNSGKTYINYVLYGLLDRKLTTLRSSIYNDFINKAKDDGVSHLNFLEFIEKIFNKLKLNLESEFKNSLDRFFSAKDGTFEKFTLEILEDINLVKENVFKHSISDELKIGKNKKIVCEISKDSDSDNLTLVIIDSNLPNDIYIDFVSDIFFKYLFPKMNNNTFLLPAERTGLNLFYQELNSNRNALINSLQKNKTNPLEVLQNMMVSNYSQPIADYIEFLNETTTLKKHKSKLKDLNRKLHNNILKGKYSIDKNGAISFLPYKPYFKGNNYQKKIELHLSSSTVKTFFSLEFYLEYIATEGAFLIIDEPELNLHPNNQRNIARLIVQIINRGVNVILSTHSDYIVRELNNLIMLSSDFKSRDEKMKKFKYDESEILSVKDVNAYFINGGTVTPMEINEDEGIIADTFDKVINSLNSSSDEIYYSKIEDREDIE